MWIECNDRAFQFRDLFQLRLPDRDHDRFDRRKRLAFLIDGTLAGRGAFFRAKGLPADFGQDHIASAQTGPAIVAHIGVGPFNILSRYRGFRTISKDKLRAIHRHARHHGPFPSAVAAWQGNLVELLEPVFGTCVNRRQRAAILVTTVIGLKPDLKRFLSREL